MLFQPVQRLAAVSIPVLLAVAALAPAAPAERAQRARPAAGPRLEAGLFLVARRGLPDPNFSETVVLLLDHGPGGALGLVVNRPSDVELSALAPRIAAFESRSDLLYVGGPVPGEDLFVLVRDDAPPDGAERVFDRVFGSRDPAVLDRLAREQIPAGRLRVYAGYAGWAPGQLENEMARGDWHLVVPDEESIFTSRPRETWSRLIPPDPTEQARRFDAEAPGVARGSGPRRRVV